MPSVKEIYSKISDVTIDADSINLNTDTVESLLSTVQADIALVKTDIANGVISDLRDGTGNAITSSARGSQRALSVQIVDGSGNQVTTFGSSSVTATQSTASSLKAQAQLLNAAGTVVEYATTGSAGTPATDVVSVQGIAGGTAINVYPLQGTTVSRSDFSATSPNSSLVSAVAGREVLTVFNEGAGNLFISAGSTCTTTSYQVRLSAGDYWECPEGQLSLAHTAVFATSGTARVCQVS
jgi:hypothetical protein